MYCRKCGTLLDESAKFCTVCGAPVEETKEEQPLNYNTNVEPKGPWKGFAIAGFALGLTCICSCWIPLLGFILAYTCGISGIVFSSLGKKSIINHSKAKTGLVLSIISLPVSFISYIVFLFAMMY